MIHVVPAPEPASFDSKVRQPGLSAIAELVGEPPLIRRPGPRRKKVADHRDKIDPERFPPFWRESLDDLLDAYGRICAYACVYIERVTGAPSVDHMMPKSKRWQDVYEWTNYRLACSLMNARKNDVPYVLDPFEVEDDWFEMELVAFQLVPKPDLDEPTRARIDDTIRRLGLNEGECPIVREEYAVNYWEKHIDLEYLERRAPFVARELRRQGKLREGDS